MKMKTKNDVFFQLTKHALSITRWILMEARGKQLGSNQWTMTVMHVDSL